MSKLVTQFAATRPIETYTVVCKGKEAGLFNTYQGDLASLALVMLMTEVGYHYEVEGDDPCTTPVRITAEKVLASTLSCTMPSGATLGEDLLYLTPIDMAKQLTEEVLAGLPITKEIYKNQYKAIKHVVQGRAGGWALFGSGPLTHGSKVIDVKFPIKFDLLTGVARQCATMYLGTYRRYEKRFASENS